jgi:hypothetical protein
MRWYNPKLEDFEWREVPNTDEEALSLVEGYAGAEGHAGGLRGVASAGDRDNGRTHQGRRSGQGRSTRRVEAVVAPLVMTSLAL